MKKIHTSIMVKARQKTKADKHLRGVLCQILDPALIEHIEFLQVNNGILTMTVKNATWASRLRFFSNEIMRITKNASIQVSKVQVQISTDTIKTEINTKIKKSDRRVEISSESLSSIYDMSKSLEPSELQESIQQLLSNAQIKKQKD